MRRIRDGLGNCEGNAKTENVCRVAEIRVTSCRESILKIEAIANRPVVQSESVNYDNRGTKGNKKFMEYKVLLNQNQEGKYIATAPTLPGYVGQGDTEEEAVANISQKVTALLSKTKVVTIDVPVPDADVQSHPWLRNFGLFKDDPAFGQMMRQVYKKRSGDYPE